MKADKRYAGVSPKQAYEWIKTGHWSFADFKQWLEVENA